MDEQFVGPMNVITQRVLAPVPTVAERPAPRWREAVGAAVLLSIVDTVREQNSVREQETAASA